jgi:hypothetical protein
MAARSLSPNRVAQKLREHRSAVATLAMLNAKRAVKAQIRARGEKPAHFTAKEIAVLAEAELQRNRTRFIAEAEHTIATWPGFAYLRINAQTQTQPISTTSAVQMFGAK